MKYLLFTSTHLSLTIAATLISLTVFANEVDLTNDKNVIVVTASGFEQQIKNAPASISVITREDLENKPFRDLTDALKSVPGVAVTGGAGTTDISIRGMSGKYTLILVDGKRRSSRETRPNSDGPGIEQGWIPPLSAIERIEVVRGPMSSLYGSDAMGGVINIITHKAAKVWNGNLRLESTIQESTQSGDMNNSNFYLNGPIVDDLLAIQLYGQHSNRDQDSYKQGFPEQKLQSINSKFSLTPFEKHRIDLELGTSLQHRISTLGRTATRSNSEHRSRRNSQSLRHNGQWEWATSDVSLSHEKINNTVRQMKIDNTVFDSQVLIPLENHIVTLGGQYKSEKLNDQGNQLNPNISQLDRWGYSLFTEDEWRLTDDFAITGGLRYDHDENYGSNWNPRIYAVWDLAAPLTLKGGISTGFITPALRQVVSDWGQITGGGARDGVILGNPNLKPEKSTNYELSLNYANDSNINGHLTGFYTQFKNKIQSYYICDDTTDNHLCVADNGNTFDFIQSRENVNDAILHGIEAHISMPLLSNIMLASTYTWSDSEQKSGVNKGKVLNRIPVHVFSTSLDWRATKTVNSWLKISYNGKETSTSRTTTNNTADTIYAGYTLWDIGASWKINDKASLYSGLYNLFDKKILYSQFGRSLDGRRYWLGISVDF